MIDRLDLYMGTPSVGTVGRTDAHRGTEIKISAEDAFLSRIRRANRHRPTSIASNCGIIDRHHFLYRPIA